MEFWAFAGTTGSSNRGLKFKLLRWLFDTISAPVGLLVLFAFFKSQVVALRYFGYLSS